MVLCANVIPAEPAARIRALVREHIQQAVNQERPAMANHRATLEMDTPSDTEALQLTLSVVPQNEAQVAA